MRLIQSRRITGHFEGLLANKMTSPMPAVLSLLEMGTVITLMTHKDGDRPNYSKKKKKWRL